MLSYVACVTGMLSWSQNIRTGRPPLYRGGAQCAVASEDAVTIRCLRKGRSVKERGHCLLLIILILGRSIACLRLAVGSSGLVEVVHYESNQDRNRNARESYYHNVHAILEQTEILRMKLLGMDLAVCHLVNETKQSGEW